MIEPATPVTPAARPARGPGARAAMRWGLRIVEQASSYLPLLLMALLALATWWLVKNTPTLEAQHPAGRLRHEADYSMSDFIVQRFAPDGELRVQIEGDSMRHFPDTDTLEIDDPRILSVAENGRITHSSARRALANGDGTEVQLQGNARVMREGLHGEPAVEFHGDFLQAFLDTERIRSHLPVTLTQGGIVVHADAMEYDNLARAVKLKGRVTAHLPPVK